MKTTTYRAFSLVLAVTMLAVIAPSGPGALADRRERVKRDDHERVHQQRHIGNAQPLPRVLEAVRSSIDGEIIEIEFEIEEGVPVYEFKYVDPRGRVRELYVDARDGTIISKGRD